MNQRMYKMLLTHMPALTLRQVFVYAHILTYDERVRVLNEGEFPETVKNQEMLDDLNEVIDDEKEDLMEAVRGEDQ